MSSTIAYTKIICLSFGTFIQSMANHWTLVLFPYLAKYNLNLGDESQVGMFASYFVTSYLFGSVLGTFFWPYADKLTSKRYMVLAGIGGQGIAMFF